MKLKIRKWAKLMPAKKRVRIRYSKTVLWAWRELAQIILNDIEIHGRISPLTQMKLEAYSKWDGKRWK